MRQTVKENLLVSLKGAVLCASLYFGVRTIMTFFHDGSAVTLIWLYPVILSFLFIISRALARRFSLRRTLLAGLAIFTAFFIGEILVFILIHESEFLFIFTPMAASILYVAFRAEKYSWLYIGLSQIVGCLIIVAVLLGLLHGGSEMEAMFVIGLTIIGLVVGIGIGLLKDAVLFIKGRTEARSSEAMGG